MTEQPDIRDSLPGDRIAIEALYRAAFPEEDLIPLLRDLLDKPGTVLSLVALTGDELAGHVLFTRCGLVGCSVDVALLGPLAVTPARQRQGIGSALVRAGLRRLGPAGVRRVYVLGDPAYYGRLGFEVEPAVAPPYPLPDEWRGAWRSRAPGDARALSDSAVSDRALSDRAALDEQVLAGTLSVPEPWRQRALWGP